MKSLIIFIITTGIIIFSACKKDENSEKFRLLTARTWTSDSLLVNGVDASTPGGILENFNGDVKFNEDGTGNFGSYSGNWRFALNETQLIITSQDLSLPLTTRIMELTQNSFKVTTTFPDPQNSTLLNIRMTFKPK